MDLTIKMARIRTIKPDFFTSEDICALTPLARLYYQACWCEADKEGRLEWKPGTMKLRYFPGDNCNINEISEELLRRNLVILYRVGDLQLAEIPSFIKHQHINPRESVSTLPPRVVDASAPVNSRIDPQGGREGKGKERKDKIPPDGETKNYRWSGKIIRLSEKDYDAWKSSYSSIDIDAELMAADSYYYENPPESGKWFFLVSNWLKKVHTEYKSRSNGSNGRIAPMQRGDIV